MFLLRTAYSATGSGNLKSSSRGSPSSARKYFSIYDDLLNVFDEGIIALSQFPSAFSGNVKAMLQLSKQCQTKQVYGSKIKDANSVFNPVFKCDSLDIKQKPRVSNSLKLPVEKPVKPARSEECSTNSIESSLGLVSTKTTHKWRKPNAPAILDEFQELAGDTEGPSKSKKCKLSTKERIEQKDIDRRTIKTVKIPRARLICFARIPATVHILW